ncbi:MAG: excisionase family DNA-binding protein [Candidatus Thorarchaeota archaeon]
MNPSRSTTQKAFVSTPQLAEWLGVFHTTVRRWIEQGQIRGIKVGRNYKIPTTEAVRILDEHEIPLPEMLKWHELTPKKQAQGLSYRGNGSGSILHKLLIVEEIEDPALVCRPDAILAANQAFANLTGFSQADLIGLDIAALMDESLKDRLNKLAKRRSKSPAKGKRDYTTDLKTKKKGQKKARITVASLNNTKAVFLLVLKVS